VLLLVFMVLAFVANGFKSMALLVLVLVGVAAASRVPVRVMARTALPLAVLLLFPLILNPFFIRTGDVLWQAGPVLITTDGLLQAGYMTLRLAVLFFVAVLLTLTTSQIALCDATAALLGPLTRFGVPAYEISMMVSIALRFIPTLLSDYAHIRTAQIARGANLGQGGPLHRIRSVVPLIVPLFAAAFRHAEALALGMESRCYHGGSKRTHYHVLKLARRDAVAIAIMAVLLVVLVVLRVLL
jgi:energy-coupling factor transport system permease protein